MRPAFAGTTRANLSPGITECTATSASRSRGSRTSASSPAAAATPTTFPRRTRCASYVLRSPHAHARIAAHQRRCGARAMPGVLAVLTAADYARRRRQGHPARANTADAVEPTQARVRPEPSSPRVRAIRSRCSRATACALSASRWRLWWRRRSIRRATRRKSIEVEYEMLPAVVTDGGRHRARRAAIVGRRAEQHRAACSLRRQGGRRAQLRRRRARDRTRPCATSASSTRRWSRARPAASTTRRRYHYTLLAGSQGVNRHKGALAAALGVPPAKIRVISPDVGGGFGPRNLLYPEFVLVAWAAKRLRRPVRWNSDRSEAFLSDFQGRDMSVAHRGGVQPARQASCACRASYRRQSRRPSGGLRVARTIIAGSRPPCTTCRSVACGIARHPHQLDADLPVPRRRPARRRCS